MSEGLFVKDGFLYFICESAAYKYREMNSKDPTDVVWRTPIKELDPLLSISLETPPDITDYNIGDRLVQKGLTISASYTDGSTHIISEGLTCTGFKSDSLGTKTVTVNYKDKTDTFNVRITDEILPGKIYSVTADKLTVKYEQTKDLRININAGPGEYIGTYSSSNPEVVSVNESGLSCNVTGLQRGTATVTVKFKDNYGNEFSDTCTVRVRYTLWQLIVRLFRIIFRIK